MCITCRWLWIALSKRRVIRCIYTSTAQQPGVVCWKGNLFTAQTNWISLTFLRWTHLLPFSSCELWSRWPQASIAADSRKLEYWIILTNEQRFFPTVIISNVFILSVKLVRIFFGCANNPKSLLTVLETIHRNDSAKGKWKAKNGRKWIIEIFTIFASK